jgi:hypothetical protein
MASASPGSVTVGACPATFRRRSLRIHRLIRFRSGTCSISLSTPSHICGFHSSSRGSRFLSARLAIFGARACAILALVVFDPFLSSRPLAEASRKAPPGQLILDHHRYTFSSVVFYTGVNPLLLNGQFNNLEYGAAAPDAPPVFLNDSQFVALWKSDQRYYLVFTNKAVARAASLVGQDHLETVTQSGGKALMTNELLSAPPAATSP